MATHREAASNYAAAAVAQTDALDVLYGSSFKADPREVASAHQKLGQSLKLAAIHADLAIADEVAALTAEVRRLYGQAVDDAQVRLLRTVEGES